MKLQSIILDFSRMFQVVSDWAYPSQIITKKNIFLWQIEYNLFFQNST